MNAKCQHCGAAFTARRSTARFCSDRCRIGAHRNEPRPLASVWLRKAAYAIAAEVFAPCGVEANAGLFDIAFGMPSTMQKHRVVRGVASYVDGITAGQSSITLVPHRDAIRVLATLTHEIVHVVALGDGHGPQFARIAGAVGLLPPWTATEAGPELVERLRAIVARLGPMPVPATLPEGATAPYVSDGRGGYVKNPASKAPWLPPRRTY